MNVWLPDLTAHTLLRALGWTLCHYIVQGFLLALTLAIALWWMRHGHARHRYLAAMCGLAMALLLVAITFVRSTQTPPVEAMQPEATRKLNTPVIAWGGDFKLGINRYGSPVWSLTMTKAQMAALARWFTALSLFWLAGSAWLAIRLRRGWSVCLLHRREAVPAPGHLQQRFLCVAERMRITSPPALRVSPLISAPMLMGVRHPVVVLPSDIEQTVSLAELDTLLAHELAHYQRGDHWQHALQCVADVLLFWHPAVLWLSHRIRHERELCCDELAVGGGQADRSDLAHALAALQQASFCLDGSTLGANRGSLLRRVESLLRIDWPPRSQRIRLAVVLLLIPLKLTNAFLSNAGRYYSAKAMSEARRP